MSQKEAFFQAVNSGDLGVVKTLLQTEPQLVAAKNEKGQSAVLLAAYSGRKEIRDFLVAQNISLELHEAAAVGQLSSVKQFVEKDAALANAFSPDGFPVIALAAVFGHPAVVEYLSGKGANVNAISTNGSGYTALTGAVASGHQEVAEFLLKHGADANYRYAAGYTPLLTAVANGHLAIVQLLLQHGADPQAQTNDGQTALTLADSRGHKEVEKFFRNRATRG